MQSACMRQNAGMRATPCHKLHALCGRVSFGRAFHARPHRSLSVRAMASDVNVTFKIRHEVQYGKVVALVGESPALGQWKVDDGLIMSWGDGHVWTADCQLPAGTTLEYKFLTRPSKGALRDQVWSPGNNHRITAPAEAESVEMFDQWNGGNGQLKVTKAVPPPPPPPAVPEGPPAVAASVPPAAPATPVAAAGADSAAAAQQREPATAVALGEAADVPSSSGSSSSDAAASRLSNNIVGRGIPPASGPASNGSPVSESQKTGWPKDGLAAGGTELKGRKVNEVVKGVVNDVAPRQQQLRKDQAKYQTAATPRKTWPQKASKVVSPTVPSKLKANASADVVPPAATSASSNGVAQPAAMLSPAENEPSRVEKWTLSELKGELAKRGLPQRGKRHELVVRLQKAGHPF